MPGTILVSVLELLGLPFPLPPTLSIKVSMGNKEYQTWDKGDFSFPLTTLHGTLIVAVQDAEGNEISYGGFETKSIVERGLWDEIFPLEGGGKVHLKLQFVLNQDEKNRIRMMRESALKRKQSGSTDLRTSTVEVATTDGIKFASPLNPETTDKNEESISSAFPSSQKTEIQPSKARYQESAANVEAKSLSTDIPLASAHAKVSPSLMRSSDFGGSSSKKRPSSPQRVEIHPSKARPQESVAKAEAKSLLTDIPSGPVDVKQSPSLIRSSELGGSLSKKRPPSPQRVDIQPSKARPQEPVAKVEVNSLPTDIPSGPVDGKQSPFSIRRSEFGGYSLKKRPSSPQRVDIQPSKARPQQSVVKVESKSLPTDVAFRPVDVKKSPSSTSSSEFGESSSKKRPSSPQRDDIQPSKARPQESVAKVEAKSLPTDIAFRPVDVKQSPSLISGSEFGGSLSKKRPSSPQRVDIQPSHPLEPVAKVEAKALPTDIPSRQVDVLQSPFFIRSSEFGGSSSKKRSSLERSPSNVMRMISAFESNVAQDNRPRFKPRLEKQQMNKVGLNAKESETESSAAMQVAGNTEELSTMQVREKWIDIGPKSQLKLGLKELDKEETKPFEEFMTPSTVETSSVEKQSENVVGSVTQEFDGDMVFEGCQAEISSRHSHSPSIGRTSLDKFVSIDYHEDVMYDWFEISVPWIFPDQRRLFCVTTSGRKVMDFMEGPSVNSDPHQEISGDGIRTSKPETKDVEPSSGLFGQILVKVAIMLGFGVLVLFTRQ